MNWAHGLSLTPQYQYGLSSGSLINRMYTSCKKKSPSHHGWFTLSFLYAELISPQFFTGPWEGNFDISDLLKSDELFRSDQTDDHHLVFFFSPSCAVKREARILNPQPSAVFTCFSYVSSKKRVAFCLISFVI